MLIKMNTDNTEFSCIEIARQDTHWFAEKLGYNSLDAKTHPLNQQLYQRHRVVEGELVSALETASTRTYCNMYSNWM